MRRRRRRLGTRTKLRPRQPRDPGGTCRRGSSIAVALKRYGPDHRRTSNAIRSTGGCGTTMFVFGTTPAPPATRPASAPRALTRPCCGRPGAGRVPGLLVRMPTTVVSVGAFGHSTQPRQHVRPSKSRLSTISRRSDPRSGPGRQPRRSDTSSAPSTPNSLVAWIGQGCRRIPSYPDHPPDDHRHTDPAPGTVNDQAAWRLSRGPPRRRPGRGERSIYAPPAPTASRPPGRVDRVILGGCERFASVLTSRPR